MSNVNTPNDDTQYGAACMETYGAEGMFGDQYATRTGGSEEEEQPS